MKQIKGERYNIRKPVIGIVTRSLYHFKRKNYIYLSEDSKINKYGFSATILTRPYAGRNNDAQYITISSKDSLSLNDGDCISILNDGTISVLWSQASNSNSILLTEACNCNCLMCPQPPKKHSDEILATNRKVISLIKPKSDQPICITGGEPTLFKDAFFETLDLLKIHHKSNHFVLLTNGKTFSDFNFTKEFIRRKPNNFITCVSLHSDIDEIHDEIAGVEGSFYKTIKGLYNLARFREKIEIRIVVNKINFDHLERLALFIYRNFPFVYHCAFMGQEIIGMARTNYEKIWIDPYEYRNELSNATRMLSRADVNTSIYNIPLCLLNKDCWHYARQSISDWKNIYLSACDSCDLKDRCAGVFSTSGFYNSKNISPIKE